MYEYIIGRVVDADADKIVLENNKIGYAFNVSAITAARAMAENELKIYSRMIVREDEIYLCGFYSREEVKLFDLLTSVSKIGPKVALGILSYDEAQTIAGYIANSDIGSLQKLPGVGKKTAERIVLEIRDKVKEEFATTNTLGRTSEELDMVDFDPIKPISCRNEAINALVSLGYNHQEAKRACESVDDGSLGLEDIIKKALAWLTMRTY